MKRNFELRIHKINYDTDHNNWKNHIVVGDPFRISEKINEKLLLYPLINKLAIVSCKNGQFVDRECNLVMSHKDSMTTFKLMNHVLNGISTQNNHNIQRLSNVDAGYESVYFKSATEVYGNDINILMMLPDTYKVGSFYGTNARIKNLIQNYFFMTCISITEKMYESNSYAFNIFLKYLYEVIDDINNDPRGLSIEVSRYKSFTTLINWPMFLYDDREIFELISRWSSKKYFSEKSKKIYNVQSGLNRASNLFNQTINDNVEIRSYQGSL